MTEKKLPKIVYTAEEEDWLVAIALQHSHIVENKKTDGATKRDKDKAWEKITAQFNVAPPGQERSLKSLREKYSKIKQNLKNRVFYFSKDAKETGGGPPKKSLPALSEAMNQLFCLLIPSTYGLSAAIGDSDLTVTPSEPLPATINEDNNIPIEEIIVIENEDSAANNMTEKNLESAITMEGAVAVEDSWERVNPAKLRRPRNPLLTRRRRRNTESETELPRKLSKYEENRLEHQNKKHSIELEILGMEREKYKLELERAQFDHERSMVELQRAKNLLRSDEEHHRARIGPLKEHSGQSTVPTTATK